MKQRDVLMLMDGIAPAIAGLIGKALSPVLERLEATEKELAAAKAALAERPDVNGIVTRAVEKAVAELPPAPTVEEIAKLVPAGRDGRDGVDGKDGAPGRDGEKGADGRDGVDGKDGLPGADGKDGRDGIDGKSVTMDDIAPIVEQAIASGFAVMPIPKDGAPGRDGRDGIDGKDGVDGRDGERGKDGTDGRDGVDGTAGRDGVDGAKGADGRDGIDGKDGIGLAAALIDRDGNLILTMTDGGTKSLGLVVGKDGAPGRDGADGFGLDDFEVIDGEDSFTLRFTRGDKVKEFTLAKPTMADFYRGVWKEGPHKAGSVVTWGGSIWLAKRDTEDRPESSDAWTLIVKKGRDGRDGEAPKGPAKVKL